MLFNDWRRRALVLAAAAASVLLASCGSDTADTPRQFSQVVVLGASGADIGNRCGVAADPLCFPAPPYAGRSTAANASSTANPGGKLYPELIAARFGAPLTASAAGGLNFAIGGARTGTIPGDTVPATITSMQGQLDQALSRLGFQISPQALVIIDGSAFGNNIRRALELAAAAPSQAAATQIVASIITQGATDIGTLLTRLYSAGARHVVLANATDLGKHPAVVAAGPTAVATATAMSTNYNGALSLQVVPAVRAASPGLNVYLLNFGQIMTEILANPAGFGISNTAQPCYPLFSAPTTPPCATPDAFLFWDELHPTAAVQKIGADRAIALLPAP